MNYFRRVRKMGKKLKATNLPCTLHWNVIKKSVSTTTTMLAVLPISTLKLTSFCNEHQPSHLKTKQDTFLALGVAEVKSQEYCYKIKTKKKRTVLLSNIKVAWNKIRLKFSSSSTHIFRKREREREKLCKV